MPNNSDNQPPPRVWLTAPVEFNSAISKGGPAFDTDVTYVPEASRDEVVEQFRRQAVEAVRARQRAYQDLVEGWNKAGNKRMSEQSEHARHALGLLATELESLELQKEQE